MGQVPSQFPLGNPNESLSPFEKHREKRYNRRGSFRRSSYLLRLVGYRGHRLHNNRSQRQNLLVRLQRNETVRP